MNPPAIHYHHASPAHSNLHRNSDLELLRMFERDLLSIEPFGSLETMHHFLEELFTRFTEREQEGPQRLVHLMLQEVERAIAAPHRIDGHFVLTLLKRLETLADQVGVASH
ncbi:hypothetical protein [Motiliproteus sp. SC1-56]|uniref:hypothetical protein n=1 Tax=Motiliproteus sp. SC1-56 TaxID=2799565 RepID=UPI001A8E2ACB|nr:hypothetical protein [Motiliproteus sp. SC1-56]